jgi:hypothetical protein
MREGVAYTDGGGEMREGVAYTDGGGEMREGYTDGGVR